MEIQALLNRIEIISDRKNYWLVRTNKGKFFEEYVKGNFISLGWDYLTLDQLNTLSEEDIKEKIAKNEKLDSTKFEDKIKITTSYNKLKTFLFLKKGDIVLIPSRNSDRIAFGKVASDFAYEDKDRIEEGVYYKKREIEWIETRNVKDLNPIFYQIKSNQHSISNINRFESYINRVIENLYIKEDNTHFILKIEKDEDINFQDLKELMDDINVLVKKINKDFNFDEDLDEFFIKISLQSKGNIEFIKGGKSLAVLAMVLSATACSSSNDKKNDEIEKYISENQEVLKDTNNRLDSLQANRKELSKIYNYGK